MNAPLIAACLGNTRIQLGETRGDAPSGMPCWRQLAGLNTRTFDTKSLGDWVSDRTRRWCVASVHRPSERRLADWVRQACTGDEYHLLTVDDLPLRVEVEFPDRVGMDRLVAAVAVNRIRDARRPAIVVDAGTATTVDAISADGVFRSGVILPGFGLIAQMLADETDLLPLVDTGFPGGPPNVVGRSTEAAIRSGLFWGGVGAIRELVTRFSEVLGARPQLYVTGGDARLLAGQVDEQAQFVPDLVLAGIVWADT
jgi:type III pantothenate kinase